MPYRIEFSEEARSAIRSVPGNYRQRIRRLIQSLAGNPRPRRAKRLREHESVYRIALDKWRVVYYVEDESETVTIIRVRLKQGPETYEDLPLN